MTGNISGLGADDLLTKLSNERADAVDGNGVSATSGELGKCLDQWEIRKVLSNVAGERLGDGIKAAELDEHSIAGLDSLQESDGLITCLNRQLIL